jgi:hypothetical protein
VNRSITFFVFQTPVRLELVEGPLFLFEAAPEKERWLAFGQLRFRQAQHERGRVGLLA